MTNYLGYNDKKDNRILTTTKNENIDFIINKYMKKKTKI